MNSTNLNVTAIKPNATCASTININLNNASFPIVDGIQTVADNRILLKD